MANTQEIGLYQLMDLDALNPNATVRTVDSGLLMSGVLVDNAQHNADINALLGLFAQTTTEYQLEVQQSASSRNQPLDENGRSKPIKAVAPYTVAFPMVGSGNAWGANFVTRAKMTVRDLARTLSRMYRGDYQWVIDHILSALYTNTNGGYSHRDIEGHGALTIQGLANGDATTYFRTATQAVATDTHYIAQVAAIADATNPFPIIATELKEHPDNSGEIIAFIPTGLVATATALAEFNSATLDPDINLGVDTTRLTGTLGVTLPVGSTLLGKTDSGVWIVEWPALAASTILAVMTDGARPLARRQFAEPELQGFRRADERADFPFYEEQWHRWEGYGGFSRIAAVVYQVSNGDTTYDIPANFTAPIP